MRNRNRLSWIVAVWCAFCGMCAQAQIDPQAEKGDAVFRDLIKVGINVGHTAIYYGYYATWDGQFRHTVIQASGTGSDTPFSVAYRPFDYGYGASSPTFMGGLAASAYWGAANRSSLSPATWDGSANSMSAARRDAIITEAQQLLGTPYCWYWGIWEDVNGNDASVSSEPRSISPTYPAYIRCDGVVQWVYERVGFNKGDRTIDLIASPYPYDRLTRFYYNYVDTPSTTLQDNGVSVTITTADNSSKPTIVNISFPDGTTGLYYSPVTTNKQAGTTYYRGVDFANHMEAWKQFFYSPPAPIIGVSGNLAFGSVQIGATATRTLTISNTGASMLTVSSISYPAGFTGGWSGTVAAGHSQGVTVTFTPVAAISYGGTLTVNSDATTGTSTLLVSGTGSCAYTLSSVAAHVAAAGTNDSITVYAGTGCAWVAASDSSWVHTSSSGSGNGTVNYTVDANIGIARSGTITVQGQMLIVEQAGNILAAIGNTPVVALADAVMFSPAMIGITNNLSNCSWDFGDGQASVDCEPSHVFSYCGPHEVTLIASGGIAPVTNTSLVSVACPFSALPKPVSLKMKSNFAPGKLDTATFNASVDMPDGFGVTNTPMSVEVAGVVIPFTLNAKGQAVNAFSSIKFSHKGTGTLWQISAKLKGDYDATWQSYGLTNATVTALPITVPVLLLFDTAAPESFYIEKPLLYKATAGKSGSGK